MRNWIDVMSEGQYLAPPNPQEPTDKVHWDAHAKTGFFGAQGAGCIFFAQDTKRILLMLRSKGVEESGTWGNCGGAHTEQETPLAAATREAREETGYSGDFTMIPALVFVKGTFRYSNYIAVVDKEFTPHLGWEAVDFEWCAVGDWPSPLHFGMRSLFDDAASMNTLHRLMTGEK
jgi:8-oxo-dGTP pyrophosphatase MutT (NUDIX family)